MVYELTKKLIIENKEFLKNKIFMEFGVHTGKSMTQIYNLYNEYIENHNCNFYGFDSFKGLPSEENDKNNPSYWDQNSPNFYRFDQSEHQIDETKKLLNRPGIKLIEGWFEDTLTDNLVSEFDKKIGLLHIDCDIYSSTYTVLDFCFKHNLLDRGSIIMYDDWAGYHEKLGEGHEFEAGEGLAHSQIMKKYNRNCLYKEKHIESPKSYEVAIFILE